MSMLHKMLQHDEKVSVSAIAGMGGIGKTELVLQYALAFKEYYSGGICWLPARSGDVGDLLVRFGKVNLGLTLPEMKVEDQLGYCWRNWREGKVLLIFDDVADYAAISSRLPPSTEPRFKILITTRLDLGPSVNHLKLDVLDEASALELLESLVGSDRIRLQLPNAKQLCKQLGYLPLALELVGRYLTRKVDLSIADLRKRLETKQLAARVLCQAEEGMTAKLGVAAAFQLNWEDLSENAQQLGCGLSLFAPTPIPWALVELCFDQQDPEDLEDLRDYELLNLHLLQRINPGIYRLHPLIRDFFLKKREEENVRGTSVKNLENSFYHNLVSVGQNIHTYKIDEASYIPHLVEASEAYQKLDEIIFFDMNKLMQDIAEALGTAINYIPYSLREKNVQNSANTLSVRSKDKIKEAVQEESTKGQPSEENPGSQSAIPSSECKSDGTDPKEPVNKPTEKLHVARSLRPLMRKLPSQANLTLDEAATVEAISNGGMWFPTLKPNPEPWLDLVFVFDESHHSPFLALQKPRWLPFINLIKSYGAFRNVRSLGLIVDSGELKIRFESSQISEHQHFSHPKELIDLTGRRLIIILSDCTSSAWYSGLIESLLNQWTNNNHVALIQLLPKRLWQRTRLKYATSAFLSSLFAGSPNNRLLASSKKPQAGRLLEAEKTGASGILLPVISVNDLTQDLSNWAKVVSGYSNAHCSGFTFKQNSSFQAKTSDPSEKLKFFLRETSENVRQLSRLLAVSPKLTLRIANLIRVVMLPKSEVLDLFEILFMSGLMEINEIRSLDPYQTELIFLNPKIREILSKTDE